MKQILLFILIFTLQLRGGAQVTVQLSQPVVNASVNPDSFEIRAKATFKNTSNQTKRFTWVRNILNIPSGWQAIVCDNKGCWNSSFASAPEQIELGPNSFSVLDVYIRPSGKVGNATVEVRVSEVGNDNNASTGKFVFSSLSPTKDLKSGNAAQIRVFPNPAIDYFMLVDNSDLVDRVVVYNIIGRQVRSFKAEEGTKYNVNDLPEGIYIVRLLNSNGSTVRTIRLNKSRIRA